MAAAEPIWAFDVSGERMVWANDAALTFWHASSSDEFLSRDYSSDSRAVRERLDQLVKAAKDGEWFRSSWTLFPNDEPTTVALDARAYRVGGAEQVIVFRLIGELGYAADDPDGLRMMVSARTTSVCASIFDLSGNLISENPAALALRQRYPRWTRPATNLHSRYQSAEIVDRIFTAIAKDSVETFEFTFSNEGRDQVFSVTARRIRDPVSGETVAHITEEDVTEKVELTRLLANANRDLEARVEERTRELERVNERLREAQKLETLGKLTGGIAHDFNNLLAVIQGNAELMLMLHSYEKDLISEITTATQRGAELTRALLAYARKQPLDAAPVDLRETFFGIRGILQRMLGEDIQLSLDVAPDLWPAFVDEGQIKDAALNLALNAKDAMAGGGRLAFELRNRELDSTADPNGDLDLDGEFIELTVADNGTGMPPEVLRKATDPFFTTKPVGSGSGLGLSMVYGFSRQSGGDLKIESDPGMGTRVRLYLPRSTDTRSPGMGAPPASHLPASTGEHVVLVEDDPAVRRYLTRSLEAQGYRITDFAAAHAALDFLDSAGDVDLLLTDVVLPAGVSGLDLAAKAQEGMQDLKVVFMSGYPERTELVEGTRYRGATLLRKPFTSEDLAKAMKEALKGP